MCNSGNFVICFAWPVRKGVIWKLWHAFDGILFVDSKIRMFASYKFPSFLCENLVPKGLFCGFCLFVLNFA
jgi:hypothetical protein